MFADLVGDGPLMSLFRRLRAKIDLSCARRPLGPAALKLPLVHADDHAEMCLGERDHVHRGRGDPSGSEQFVDHAIDDGEYIIAQQIIVHLYISTTYE